MVYINKNSIKDDTYGIRIGLCAMTSRGLIEEDCDILSDLIYIYFVCKCKSKKLIEFKNELNDYSNEINNLKKEVIEFTNKFFM